MYEKTGDQPEEASEDAGKESSEEEVTDVDFEEV